MMKLPKTKQGAITAAKKAMGPEAIEGVDFDVRNTGAGWEHFPVGAAPTEGATAAPKKSRARKAPETAEAAPKAPKAARKAPVAKTDEPAAKAQSKGAIITALMKRPEGADVLQLSAAAGWQKHSVRGFIAGNLKKNGINVVTSKEGEGAERRTVYRIPEEADQEAI